MNFRAGALLPAACAVLIGTGGCTTPSTGPVPDQAGTPGTATTGAGDGAMARLVELAAQRLATADTVAASKWASGGPVNDPAREKVVLEAASAGSAQRGLDAGAVSTVFRDQIEASKAVQYGLFSDWSADPSHVPAGTPDLSRIRPVLDGVTGELLDALAGARADRADAGCTASLRRATADVERGRHLDDLHRRGLERAVRSLCG